MDYHSNRFNDNSLLVYNSNKLIAVLPANKVENTLFSHQGLSYGGLVYGSNIRLEDVISVFKAILIYLKSINIDKLIIKELPKFYSLTPNDELHYLAFLLKAKLNRVDALSVINLNGDYKQSKLRKRGLKKAESLDLKVTEESDFSEFWNKILIPNLKQRFNASPTHSLAEIELLYYRFPNQIKQFNVYKEDEILAGITIFETEYVAHIQYISANNSRQETGSLDFLVNELLSNIYKDKLYFDFGVSNENYGLNINKGLLYFKESFGARTITQSFYEFKTSNYKLLDAVML
ncbi:GNAT family N-acetyltransferase [Aurantibacter sp.]|uniref:GNAT family N-acetyltransferase n=1 Tax=Aurantibacter sp. TaxID=2807103 RepID=UPI0035C83469